MFKGIKEFFQQSDRPVNLLLGTGIGIVANWGLIVSILVGLWAYFWGNSVQIIHSPDVQFGVVVFLVALWTYIGISTVARRNKAQLIRSEHSISYGLTFLTINPIFQKRDDGYSLQFEVMVQNFTAGPIKFSVEKFTTILDNRTLPEPEENKASIFMPRGALRGSRNVPFQNKDLKDLIGKQVKGRIEISLLYGHVEGKMERRLIEKLDVYVEMNENGTIGLANVIVGERDEPFTPH